MLTIIESPSDWSLCFPHPIGNGKLHILRHKVVHNFTVKLIKVKLYINLGRQMCISGIAMGYQKFSRLTNITFNQEQHHGGAHEQILKRYFAQGCLGVTALD